MKSTDDLHAKTKRLLVLKEAMLSSLYATKRLVSKYTGKDYQKWVKRINNLIDKAFSKYQKSKKEGIADFTIFANIENNIRKWHFHISRIWLQSWGIDVRKRIRKSGPNQDYFNQLLDIAGAIQRDFACRYYWLPSVVEYNYYNDTNEIINIMHEDLPSLDFIEITRPFILEMTMWFTLFHIPVYKCKQYFWYFLIECRPYLDWIYKGGRRGVNSNEKSVHWIEKSFSRMDEMDHKMQDIINLAKIQYGTINTFDKVTDLSKVGLAASNKLPIANFLSNQEVEKRYRNFLNSTAIKKLFQQVNEESRKIGIQFHNFLLNSFPQPKSLRHVIENGDMYTDDRILIIKETFLSDNGLRGKADLIVLLKCNIDNKLVWKPILLIDIKSKSAYNWNFYGRSSRYNKDRIVPQFNLIPRPVTESEWVKVIQETPNEYEQNQLKIYHKLIKKIFVATLKLTHVNKLDMLRGILVVDPVVDNKTKLHGWMLLKNEIVATINSFVEQLINSNQLGNLFLNNRVEIKPEHTEGTFSLIIEKLDYFNDIIPEILLKPIKVRTAIFEKFKRNESTGEPLREFNLYLSDRTNTSSGDISAWISRFTNIIKIIEDRIPTKKVLVLDIMSELSRSLDHPLMSISNVICEKENIEIIDLSEFSKKYKLPKIDPNYDVYIICGWDLFTQVDINEVSKSVEAEILTSLPQNKIVYWIDRASNDFHQNDIYQKPSLFPYNLFHRPLRSFFVTNLIFDLPSPPRNLLERSSQYPEYRVLVEFSSTNKFIPQLSYIHELRHINSRFNNKFKYRSYRRKLSLKPKQERKIVAKAISLLPWLNNFIDVEIFNLSYDSEIALNIQSIEQGDFLQGPRLSYCPNSPLNENEDIISKELINSNLQLKANFQDVASARQTTIFPLHTNLLKPGWDGVRAKHFEILRIKGILALIENSENLSKIIPKTFRELINQSLTKLHTNGEIRDVILLIENFEIERDENQLWNIIKPVHHWHIKKFILQNREINPLVQDDLKENLYFGISIYFLLKILSYKFTSIDDRIIISMWKQNFSFILRQIGFKVINHNFPQSKYRIKTLYHHLNRNLESLEKSKTRHNTITYIRYGRIWQNNRFALLEYRDNTSNKLIEIIFDISWKQKLSPDANLYYTVTNINIKDLAKTELMELNFNECAFFYSLGYEYFSIYDKSISKWNLIGRIRFIKYKEVNKLQALRIDQSNLNIDEVKFNTHDHTLSIEVVERQEIDEPIEIIIKIGYEGGEFFIEHFNLEDYQDSGNDFDDLAPIWTTWFEYTVEFLNYIHYAKGQFLKDTDHNGNKRLYQLNVFRGIFYNKFKFLRPYIETSKFHNSEFLKYPRKCEKLYKQNLNIIEDGLTDMNTGEILVSHLPAYCQVSDIPFDIIFKSPYNPIKKPGSLKKMDNKFRHWLCIQMTFLNLHVLPKSLVSKIHKKVVSPLALKILALKGFEEDSESGEIFKLTFDFEMEEDEFGNEILNPVFHQDLDIISTIYELTGTWISSTYPNAHLEPNKFIFDKISFGNGGSLYFHYFYLLTGQRLFYEIPGSSNSCLEQIRHYFGFEKFESIIDKGIIENYEDYVNMVTGYKQELKDHFKECLFCKKGLDMVDSGEILFDLIAFSIEKGEVFVEGIQKLPCKRIEEDSKISWKFSKMDDLEDIVEKVVQMGREVIIGKDLSEDYFPVNFYLSQEILSVTFADFLDNLVSDLPMESRYRKENNIEVDWLIQRLDTMDNRYDTRAPIELQSKYKELQKLIKIKDYNRLFESSQSVITELLQNNSLQNVIYKIQLYWFQFLGIEDNPSMIPSEREKEMDHILELIMDLFDNSTIDINLIFSKLRSERILFHGDNYVDKSVIYIEQGLLLERNKNYDEAKDRYLEAKIIRDNLSTLQNEVDRTEIGLLLGNLYFNLSTYDISQSYYEQVENLIDDNKTHLHYIDMKINLARVNFYIGNISNAKSILGDLNTTSSEVIPEDKMVYYYDLCGNLELFQNAYLSSLDYFKRSYELLQKITIMNPLYLAYILKNIIILQSIVEPQKLEKPLINRLERLYMETDTEVELEIYYLIGLYFQTYEIEYIIELLKILEDHKNDIYICYEIISLILVLLTNPSFYHKLDESLSEINMEMISIESSNGLLARLQGLLKGLVTQNVCAHSEVNEEIINVLVDFFELPEKSEILIRFNKYFQNTSKISEKNDLMSSIMQLDLFLKVNFGLLPKGE